MTKVKICGITNSEDALLSAKFGADALGFNFYEKSARYISPERAREIIEQLPANVLKVGVFVNADLEKILETVETTKLDAVQLHGEETPEFVARLKEKFAGEIIKAFRVSEDFKPADVLEFQAADAVLLDAYSEREHGGTGETFDWAIAKRAREIFPKMYLAGGLSAENVGRAIKKVYPFAVDACSLLEKTKGGKSKTKVRAFCRAAKDIGLYVRQINNIYDVLWLLETRPVMYLGEKSLTRLHVYVSGFFMAVTQAGVGKFDVKKFFSQEFNELVRKKLEVKQPNTFYWLQNILQKVGGNEEKAFDLFFALLKEFKLEKEDLSETEI